MDAKDKFFLQYCIDSFNGLKTNGLLRGNHKKIYNSFLSGHELSMFILCTDPLDRINFLLFCAAANNEL